MPKRVARELNTTQIEVFDKENGVKLASNLISDKTKKLEERVQSVGPIEEQKTVWIKVSNAKAVTPQGTPKSFLQVELSSEVSGKTFRTQNELTRVGDGEYEGAVELKSDFISVLEPNTTTVAIGEVYRDKGDGVSPDVDLAADPPPRGLTEELVDLVNATSSRFPNPRFVGQFTETGRDVKVLTKRYPGEIVQRDEVPNTALNMVKLGFEAVTVKTIIEPGVKKANATLKVRRPANTIFWNFHGGHNGTMFLTGDRDRLVGLLPGIFRIRERLKPHFLRYNDVKVWGLLACSALDVNDYNNLYFGPEGDKEKRSVYGGRLWDEVTRSGAAGTVHLGYNAVAPWRDPADAERVNIQVLVAKEFKKQLAGGLPTALAWMAANVVIARQSTHDEDYRLHCLHATAIDSSHYYFIPHDNKFGRPPGADGDKHRDFPVLNELFNADAPVRRVHRNEWDKAPTKFNLDSRGATEAVSISGI